MDLNKNIFLLNNFYIYFFCDFRDTHNKDDDYINKNMLSSTTIFKMILGIGDELSGWMKEHFKNWKMSKLRLSMQNNSKQFFFSFGIAENTTFPIEAIDGLPRFI